MRLRLLALVGFARSPIERFTHEIESRHEFVFFGGMANLAKTNDIARAMWSDAEEHVEAGG